MKDYYTNLRYLDNKIALVLLEILRKKERINEPTYRKTVQEYLNKLKEAA